MASERIHGILKEACKQSGMPREGYGMRSKSLVQAWFSLTRRCDCRHEDHQSLLFQQVNNGPTLSFPAIIQNLPDALFGDAKNLSQGRD
jgi:hypothetical protein